MKTRFIFLLMVLIILALCACSSQSNVQPTPTPSATSKIELTPAPTATPTPTQSTVSYTTGLPLDVIPEYKPVGVVIENSAAARPQFGLQSADVVYEAPVEGCTRFFCIFNDNLPEKIGPVRSARLYFIKIQQEWDSAFVHFGGPSSGYSNVYTSASDHIDVRIDFIKGKYNDYYWRDNSKSAPHNAFTNVKALQTLLEEPATIRPMIFDSAIEYPGQTISDITLPFYTGAVTYKYDASQDLLTRHMDDKPFIDAETDQAVQVKNLVIQYCSFGHGDEAKGRWLCELLGSGKAEFVIGGKHIVGTWERENYESKTTYKDSGGKEIVLRPGNTWIAIHPDSEKVTVNY